MKKEEKENRVCERCGREINHLGKCLPCNYFYKHKVYFPGLKESEEYDKKHNLDIGEIKRLIEKKEYTHPNIRPIIENKDVDIRLKNSNNLQENECRICGFKFDTKNSKHEICRECYNFYRKAGGIRSYEMFLMAFKLSDCIESKENYIQFVDNLNKFMDIYF